jgi:hypothetical protein
MSNWREYILNQFVPGAARLTLVADPDCLLLDELIFECIQEKGFELVQLEIILLFATYTNLDSDLAGTKGMIWILWSYCTLSQVLLISCRLICFKLAGG